METNKRRKYLKARTKVETLKGFYGHLAVYIILNTIMILFNANVFKGRPSTFPIGKFILRRSCGVLACFFIFYMYLSILILTVILLSVGKIEKFKKSSKNKTNSNDHKPL